MEFDVILHDIILCEDVGYLGRIGNLSWRWHNIPTFMQLLSVHLQHFPPIGPLCHCAGYTALTVSHYYKLILTHWVTHPNHSNKPLCYTNKGCSIPDYQDTGIKTEYRYRFCVGSILEQQQLTDCITKSTRKTKL